MDKRERLRSDLSPLDRALYDFQYNSGYDQPKGTVFYHGTISSWAESIQKKGLRPTAKNQWYANTPRVEDHAVYLAKDLKAARKYAKGKTNYARAEAGEKFTFASIYRFTKDEDAPFVDPQAQPVVFKVRLTREQVAQLERDEADPSRPSYKFYGTIEPSQIEEI